MLFLCKWNQCMEFGRCVNAWMWDTESQRLWIQLCLSSQSETRLPWWNQNEIPCACRSAQACPLSFCAAILLCTCYAYNYTCIYTYIHTLYGWVNNCISHTHTWGLISLDMQDKRKGSGELVAKQLLSIQTLLYSYDESRLKAWQLTQRQRDRREALTQISWLEIWTRFITINILEVQSNLDGQTIYEKWRSSLRGRSSLSSVVFDITHSEKHYFL